MTGTSVGVASNHDVIEHIFREVLLVEPPARGIDLVSSGLLDSLAIANLIVELEQRFEIRPTADELDLDSFRTIETIEEWVARCRQAMECSAPAVAAVDASIIRLIKPGDGQPLFLLHDSHAALFTVAPIAASLDTPRPIFGLQARGLEPGSEPQRTVEEMAATYTEAIRRVQPDGPYAVAGHSFGGLLAYEVACRLAAAGEQVDLLALIDPQVANGAQPLRDRVSFRLQLPFRHLRHTLAEPRTRLPSVARKLRVRLSSTPPAPAFYGHTPRIVELARLADASEASYRPRPFPGDAVLFLAAERKPGVCDPLPVWATLIRGELSVVGIPGGHEDLLYKNLPLVGGPLSALLNR
jgi:acetoacetyl-CoA synthetase